MAKTINARFRLHFHELFLNNFLKINTIFIQRPVSSLIFQIEIIMNNKFIEKLMLKGN